MKKTHSSYSCRERYHYDFKACRGWAQFDTREDASYYGNWACPLKKTLVSFAEGDETITTCETTEEFVREVKKWFKWAVGIGYEPSIDPGLKDEYVKLWSDLNLTTEKLREEFGK